MYYKSRWNYIVIQQRVFSRHKITYYIASFFSHWKFFMLKIYEVSDFSNPQFLDKMQKVICRLPKHFTNCELWMAILNPAYFLSLKRKNLGNLIQIHFWSLHINLINLESLLQVYFLVSKKYINFESLL